MSTYADFSAYVEGSRPRLLRLAVLLAGTAGDGEDLLQSVYTSMWPRWRSVRRGDPDAYARRALSNAAISRWRRHRGERITSVIPECAFIGATGRAEDWSLLADALRALPAVQRAVVVLRYYADQSERQVADVFSIPVGTVKSHASRGLAQLRTSLTEEVLS